MLEGRYRDVVAGADGRVVARTPWRCNLVVDTAFTLLGGLLKQDPDAVGPLSWAVGTGEVSWDARQPAPVARTTRLTAEVTRLQVPPQDIGYVDRDGSPTSAAGPDLELRLTFVWPDRPMTLREFGLFGGAGAEGPDGGVMINHVIHRRIDLAAGQRLSRQLRLMLGRHGHSRWVDGAPHWLEELPVRTIDGVGDHFGSVLEDLGIPTLGALARSDPAADEARLPRISLLEWRGKAQLALRTGALVHAPGRLRDQTVSQVLRLPTAQLARDSGVPEVEVLRVREQLATLELALGHDFLGPLTVGELAP